MGNNNQTHTRFKDNDNTFRNKITHMLISI